MIDDIDRIMAVMAAAFDPAYGEAWTRRQVEDALLIGNCHYLLVDADGRPQSEDAVTAGFALSRTGFEEEELLLFAVHPDWRGRGIGRNMLEGFAAAAASRGVKRLLLEMREGNPAEHLYRDFGFLPIGKRPKYYRTAEGTFLDAVTFEHCAPSKRPK